MPSTMIASTLVFEAVHYRDVLRRWLLGGRSQATLARRVGGSRSLVSMIVRGERDLRVASARPWGRALGLTGAELAYFEALVHAEHGETLDLRRAARRCAGALRGAPDPADAPPGLIPEHLSGALQLLGLGVLDLAPVHAHSDGHPPSRK